MTDSPSHSRLEDHDQSLAQQITSSRVVVFCSNLTDIRPITTRLVQAGVSYRVVVMGMGSVSMRERFHRLQQLTGWTKLPQVFVDGRFVGGYEEFFAYGFAASNNDTSIPAAAKWFGYGGLIPFIGLSLAFVLVSSPTQDRLLAMLIAYGAVILSFIGAIHWGLALRSVPAHSPWRAFGVAVAPALVAWFALMLSPVPALLVLAAGLVSIYMVDRIRLNRADIAPWYLRLRARLTAGALASLIVASMAAALAMPFSPSPVAAVPAGVTVVSF